MKSIEQYIGILSGHNQFVSTEQIKSQLSEIFSKQLLTKSILNIFYNQVKTSKDGTCILERMGIYLSKYKPYFSNYEFNCILSVVYLFCSDQIEENLLPDLNDFRIEAKYIKELFKKDQLTLEYFKLPLSQKSTDFQLIYVNNVINKLGLSYSILLQKYDQIYSISPQLLDGLVSEFNLQDSISQDITKCFLMVLYMRIYRNAPSLLIEKNYDLGVKINEIKHKIQNGDIYGGKQIWTYGKKYSEYSQLSKELPLNQLKGEELIDYIKYILQENEDILNGISGQIFLKTIMKKLGFRKLNSVVSQIRELPKLNYSKSLHIFRVSDIFNLYHTFTKASESDGLRILMCDNGFVSYIKNVDINPKYLSRFKKLYFQLGNEILSFSKNRAILHSDILKKLGDNDEPLIDKDNVEPTNTAVESPLESLNFNRQEEKQVWNNYKDACAKTVFSDSEKQIVRVFQDCEEGAESFEEVESDAIDVIVPDEYVNCNLTSIRQGVSRYLIQHLNEEFFDESTLKDNYNLEDVENLVLLYNILKFGKQLYLNSNLLDNNKINLFIKYDLFDGVNSAKITMNHAFKTIYLRLKEKYTFSVVNKYLPKNPAKDLVNIVGSEIFGIKNLYNLQSEQSEVSIDNQIEELNNKTVQNNNIKAGQRLKVSVANDEPTINDSESRALKYYSDLTLIESLKGDLLERYNVAYSDLNNISNDYFKFNYRFILDLLGKFGGDFEKAIEVYIGIFSAIIDNVQQNESITQQQYYDVRKFLSLLLNISGGVNESGKVGIYIKENSTYGISNELVDTIYSLLNLLNIDKKGLNLKIRKYFIGCKNGVKQDFSNIIFEIEKMVYAGYFDTRIKEFVEKLKKNIDRITYFAVADNQIVTTKELLNNHGLPEIMIYQSLSTFLNISSRNYIIDGLSKLPVNLLEVYDDGYRQIKNITTPVLKCFYGFVYDLVGIFQSDFKNAMNQYLNLFDMILEKPLQNIRLTVSELIRLENFVTMLTRMSGGIEKSTKRKWFNRVGIYLMPNQSCGISNEFIDIIHQVLAFQNKNIEQVTSEVKKYFIDYNGGNNLVLINFISKLEKMSQRGTFRSELVFKINVLKENLLVITVEKE